MSRASSAMPSSARATTRDPSAASPRSTPASCQPPLGVPSRPTLDAVVTTAGLRTADEPPVRERPAWRPRVPGLVAWVVRLAAVFAVLDQIHPPERRPHLSSRPLAGVVNGSVFAAAVFAAGAMLVLA